MTGKRNRLGVGPKWALPTVLYYVAALIAHFAAYPRFVIALFSAATCAIVGASLVIMGACMYAAAWVSLRRGFRTGTLVTDGPYAVMRHPLYASSIFFILPGVALALRSWLVLPMPVVAYVAFRICLSGKDDDLHKQYGGEFDRCRNTTNALFPTPPRWLRAWGAVRERKE